MTGFSAEQEHALLLPLSPSRVEKRSQAGRQFSYLSQADVRAHAIRTFGFGGYDCETLDVRQLFEEQNSENRWNVGYLVTMQVTIRNPDGEPVCRYSESAIGQSTQPNRGEAADMALKTASSDAMKRCFMNLGTQFGLSLYFDGRTTDVVGGTLPTVGSPTPAPVPPPAPAIAGSGPDVEPALAALMGIADDPDMGSRIRRIAAWKIRAREVGILDTIVDVDGTPIALHLLADHIAAGRPEPAAVEA